MFAAHLCDTCELTFSQQNSLIFPLGFRTIFKYIILLNIKIVCHKNYFIFNFYRFTKSCYIYLSNKLLKKKTFTYRIMKKYIFKNSNRLLL